MLAWSPVAAVTSAAVSSWHTCSSVRPDGPGLATADELVPAGLVDWPLGAGLVEAGPAEALAGPDADDPGVPAQPARAASAIRPTAGAMVFMVLLVDRPTPGASARVGNVARP